MRAGILTDLERKQAKAYVKQDGQRIVNVRVLTIRAQRYLPKIKDDVELLQQVLETYERNKKVVRPTPALLLTRNVGSQSV